MLQLVQIIQSAQLWLKLKRKDGGSQRLRRDGLGAGSVWEGSYLILNIDLARLVKQRPVPLADWVDHVGDELVYLTSCPAGKTAFRQDAVNIHLRELGICPKPFQQ